MNKISNLFHDCGYLYLSTVEPDIGEPITMRLRTGKGNVARAWVEISYDGKGWTDYELQYEKEDRTGYFSYFKGIVPGQDQMFKYRFRAENSEPGSAVYYTRTYIGAEEPDWEFGTLKPDDYWTLVPGYHTPDWAKGIVWYSLMPDAFYNGDVTNDETISGENLSNPWNIPQHNLKYKYGGDLKGIEKKLDYIKELGCDAVFINPIFKSAQNAGYGPEFYKQIEHALGNRQALAELAEAVHSRGMYYMLDVVLTFVAVHDIWYNKGGYNPLPGAAQDWDSEYHTFFYFTGEEGDTASYKSDWGGVKLNYGSEKLRDRIYRDEDSYLKYYCGDPFDVDALRFDCGGALSGTRKDGTPIKDWEIMGEIRGHMRAVNPEIMLLSEYSFNRSVEKGVWDSRWNLEFVIWGQRYMLGEVPESVIFDRFNSEINSVPRAFALCQYNSMNDHDRPRKLGIEPYAFRAWQLIHMTQIGAPSIYFGDEIRIQRERGAFYAMEWNEAYWDYGVLYETKALLEARKACTALRDGIIQYLCVDDDDHLLAFARINEESTVITVSSRNPESRKFAIDARELGEVDGTVFTDWLGGRQYRVKEGYLDVILPAGGSIFVKGERSASYRDGFAVVYDAGSDARVMVLPERTISMEGEGAFVYTEAFNALELSALVSAAEGTGTVLVCTDRDPMAAFIGATVRDEELVVTVREKYGEKVRETARRNIHRHSYVRIVRDERNACSVSVTRTPGGRWEEIVSDVQVDLPNHVKSGMTATGKKAVFENIRVKYPRETVLCDDFRQEHSAMFDFTPDMEMEYGAQGLVLTPREGRSALLTNAYREDWTFQTRLCMSQAAEGDCAGILCQQDDEIYLMVGRMRLDKDVVFFFGRATDGKLELYGTAKDGDPDHMAIVQLQRVGTVYSAIFSYDGRNWQPIGDNLIANLCRERVGLMVQGKTPAAFDYACFGDAIHDGSTFRTPHSPAMGALSFAPMKQVTEQPRYEIISGCWDYGEEGFVQSSREAARMGISNKRYGDFKIDGTYLIEEGDGYLGFEFGKDSWDSLPGDGYLLSLNTERMLSLARQGQELFAVPVPGQYGQEIRLCVENRNGVFAVFAGLAGSPLIVLRDFARTEGAVCYVMEGIKGHINNYLTASDDAAFYLESGYENLRFGADFVEKNWLHTHAFLSPFGVGVTDFEACVWISIKEFGNVLQKPWVGMYLCSSEGSFGKNQALAVAVDHTYKLLLKNGENILASAQLEKGKRKMELKVVLESGMLRVFVDDREEPLITYSRGIGNGGAVSLCANMAAVVFEHMTLKNLA